MPYNTHTIVHRECWNDTAITIDIQQLLFLCCGEVSPAITLASVTYTAEGDLVGKIVDEFHAGGSYSKLFNKYYVFSPDSQPVAFSLQ